LIIHGNADTIISFEQGERVFKNYKWEKYFIEIQWANHNGIFREHGEKLRDKISNFLQWRNFNEEAYILFD
jgi:hypothetical protein